MSGGGGGSNRTTTPAAAAATTGTPMQTVQPGMPGQINTLANQLAAGFGQQPADILAQLQQYYQPMSLPNYAPMTPATPAPTPAVTPKPITKPRTATQATASTGRGGERTWGR